MTDKNNDEFSRRLEIFDRQELNDIYGRRTTYKPLYEYFQKLTLEVGVEYCNLNRSTLLNYQLNTRWAVIKDMLAYVENPKIWDELISHMYKIRNGIEHNDFYDPNPKQLTEIRTKASEFKEWIIRVASEYYKISINFTFKQSFYQISKRYLYEAESMSMAVKNSPFSAG
jgi:hypothetical protein